MKKDHWHQILAERTKYIRGLRNLSQQQLADKASISQSTLALLETAKTDPALSTVSKLAMALDVDVATLFSSQYVFVFDIKRLESKYKSAEELSANLYQALGTVLNFAKKIKFQL